MSINLYDITVPTFTAALTSLEHILQKGEEATKSDNVLQLKLAEDMLPMAFQVHTVTNMSYKTLCRITGAEPAEWKMDEIKSTADAYARIEKTRAFIASVDEATVNSYATKTVPLGLGKGINIEITGVGYVTAYCLPNLYFHLTTAYALFRKEGVPLGKRDYQEPFITPFIQQ